MKYEKCNVVMLPTEKASKIWKDKEESEIQYGDCHPENPDWVAQHLYFLSDEEIKVGDWIYDSKLNIVIQYKSYKDGCKKIIATTDESLQICIGRQFMNSILDYKALPRPSNEFLKKYCELGGIDKVLVEYEKLPNWGKEEITILKLAPDNTITIKPIQQKESYSKEEVVKILHDYQEYYGVKRKPFNDLLHKQVDDWIKENLK